MLAFCNDCKYATEAKFKKTSGKQFLPDGEYVEEEGIFECGNCGSENIVPASPCKICYEYFSDEDLTKGICPDCIGVAKTVIELLNLKQRLE